MYLAIYHVPFLFLSINMYLYMVVIIFSNEYHRFYLISSSTTSLIVTLNISMNISQFI